MSGKKARRNSRKSDYEFLETVCRANTMARIEGPKRKTWSVHDLKTIKPLTPNQEDMFHAWMNHEHLCAYGTAGTGKTYLGLYLALNEVCSPRTPQDKIIIVRSVVPTRDVGFLPGDLDEKISVYESPYRDVCAELVGRPSTYDDMKEAGIIHFMSTSFIRGLTWDNAIVVVDEGQNMSFHEINSIMTRLGDDSRLIFTGDLAQADLRASQTGMGQFINIVSKMKDFGTVRFNHNDIVRSNIVKSWIIATEEYAAA